MNYIKLIDKDNGKVFKCDIYLSDYPQHLALEINRAEVHHYASLAELAEKWEIVSATNEIEEAEQVENTEEES